jgi:EAL domain-containing protein (putative c-di-GMP-specific phosphodiesterase class I)
MLRNYYFDICAIYILTTIAIISFSRRQVPAYRQRAYGMLLLSFFITTIEERLEITVQLHPVDAAWYPLVLKGMASIYFIFHLASAFFYLVYIMSVLDMYLSLKSLKSFFSTFFAYSIGLFLVVLNWFLPVLFHFGPDGTYYRDGFIGVFYVLAFYYILYALWLIMRYNSLMRLRIRIMVASYVFFSVTGIVIQFFYPTLLVENFFNAISITLVFITLQNPSEMVDDSLNILNRKAYFESIDLRMKRKSPISTIFVTIDNIRALSSEIGYMQSQEVLKQIAKYLKRVGSREFKIQSYAYRYAEYTFTITVNGDNAEDSRMVLNAVAKRLQEPWSSSGMAIKIEGHCFLINYPDNYETTSELINKIDIITEDIAVQTSLIVDVDEYKFNEKKQARDFDLLARENIDAKKAVIKFQPVLSKKYRINYCADILCFFMDEAGNEVDVRGHIPDVKVTQSLLDTDEFVYRRACRALSFWNAGDKNGKYRAVVGLSQGEISRTDFLRRIKKILREEKAEASWISLKLTETTVTTMNNVAERNLKLLGDLNCQIIVDRFGSGYGDLDRILSLPVVQVNVDISVLRSAMESEKMKMVAQGIVNLFHDVSIFVGASDISCREEMDMAEELGCDFLVGDYMGPPMNDGSYVKTIDAYFEEA